MESDFKRDIFGKKSYQISSFYDIKSISRSYWDFLNVI